MTQGPSPDTIVAVASGPGRASRALVRLSGPGVPCLLEELGLPLRRAVQPARLHLKSTHAPALTALPCLALIMPGPDTYTGEDCCELLLPGNPHLLERVLRTLKALATRRGHILRDATPGEFTARAYLHARLSIEGAEGVAALIAARSERDLQAAQSLRSGEVGARARAWCDNLATLLALVEAGIDFVDQEDVVPISPSVLRCRIDAARADLAASLGRDPHAVPGGLIRVALAGRPSAGKSTLFNALLGRRRAAVAPEPGTTRDALEEELDLSDTGRPGLRVLLIDVAGLDGLWLEDSGTGPTASAAAQRMARAVLDAADIVLACDPRAGFEPPTDLHTGRVLRVRTKADLPMPGVVGGSGEGGWLAVCAFDGRGLDDLRRRIADAAWQAAGGHSGDIAAVLPRHRAALHRALESLHAAASLIEAQHADPGAPGAPLQAPELVAGELRAALDALGELTGRLTPDDVIGRIFATFCIGK